MTDASQRSYIEELKLIVSTYRLLLVYVRGICRKQKKCRLSPDNLNPFMHRGHHSGQKLKKADFLYMHGCSCWSVVGSVRDDALGPTVVDHVHERVKDTI